MTRPAPLPDLRLCPGLPLGASADGDGTGEAPIFGAPWQAQAFAMTLQLHERGLFTWPEWAEALTQQIRAAQAAGDPDQGDTYWQHWLAALESLVAAKGAGSAGELQRTAQAWEQAAGRTPHGQPIILQRDDYPTANGHPAASPGGRPAPTSR
jgi:nitrile hydratase accessory protein